MPHLLKCLLNSWVPWFVDPKKFIALILFLKRITVRKNQPNEFSFVFKDFWAHLRTFFLCQVLPKLSSVSAWGHACKLVWCQAPLHNTPNLQCTSGHPCTDHGDIPTNTRSVKKKKLKNRWKVLVFSFTLTAPSAIAASLFCTFLLVTMAVICGVRMRLMDALVWPATSYNRSSIYGRVLNEVVGWFASPTINTRIYYYPTWHYKKMKL